MSSRRPYIIAGIWFFLGLIYSGQSFFYTLSVGREYVWQRSFFHSFVFCLEWGLLTPVVLALTEKFRLDVSSLWRNIVIHFFVGLTIAFLQQTVYVYVTNFVDNGFVLTRSFGEFFPSIIGFFEYGVLVYWAIVFFFHAAEYYRRYQHEEQNASQLRTQLAESQLQSLKMQLQPHFLFNTLNAISVLVKKEPSLAQKMIVRLSDLLRLSLERGNENEVTLREELELLDTYLEIEKVRFGDRLSVTKQIEPAALEISVPTFILQPIAENAVRHGITQRAGDGWIAVSASLKGAVLQISVSDGGVRSKKKKESSAGLGVGLENTKKRLTQLYGNRSSLELSENDMNGFTCLIQIPAE